MKTEINEESETLIIIEIPDQELSINPNIEYYDVTQDYLNQFTATDYNTIKKRVEKSLKEKIEVSPLKTNAENRLISELQKIYILTHTMGWKLQYKNQEIQTQTDLQKIDFKN